MKRLALPLVALLFACGESPTEPASADLGLPDPSFEATILTERALGWDDEVHFVDCANGGVGEYVQLAGTTHILLHVTTDDQGGRHATFHEQQGGVTGVGLTTGDVYRSTGALNSAETRLVDYLPWTDTYVARRRLIGPGRDNNLLWDVLIHMTLTANGDLTVDIDFGDVQCV